MITPAGFLLPPSLLPGPSGRSLSGIGPFARENGQDAWVVRIAEDLVGVFAGGLPLLNAGVLSLFPAFIVRDSESGVQVYALSRVFPVCVSA